MLSKEKAALGRVSKVRFNIQLMSTKLIVLAMTITLISFAGFQLESKNSEQNAATHQWLQPQAVTVNYPVPISQDHWQFDYEGVESVLQKVSVNRKGLLLINGDMAVVLAEAVMKLPDNMNEHEFKRVAFLTAKGLPGLAGEQLALILNNFYRYHQVSKHVSGRGNIKTSQAQKVQLFQQDLALKEKYLSKSVVEALFGQKNRLLNYLFARRKINENSGLSQQQKKQGLAELEQNFKRKRQAFQAKIDKVIE